MIVDIYYKKRMGKNNLNIGEIIAEAVRISAIPVRDLLTEMAVPLKDYKARVDGLRFQLVENWCLCEYCHLYDTDNDNFHHWLTELASVINNLKKLKIKEKIDRRKILTRMLVDDYDYNDPQMIEQIARDKFDIEGIMNVEQRMSICVNFAWSIADVIKLISFEAFSTKDYLIKQFGSF